MKIHNLVRRVEEASEGVINLKFGILGVANYGLVFLNIKELSEFTDLNYPSMLYHLGSAKKYQEKEFINLDDYQTYLKIKCDDLCYVGAIKTLVPSLDFGGNELLFEVGVFIKTLTKKIFPALIYWGKKGLTIGGWKSELFKDFIGVKKVRNSYEFVPIEFTQYELEELVEAIELGLEQVPISDFEGIYYDEYGKTHLGVEFGIPFVNFEEINYVDYTILGSTIASDYYNEFCNLIFEIMLPDFEKKSEVLKKKGEKLGSAKFKQLYMEIYRDTINDNLEKLLRTLQQKKDKRIAFQVLGVIILEYGAKMPDDVKKLIIKNSHWKDERNNFKDKKARAKRRKHLFEFNAKIIKYKEGEIIKIP